MKTLRLCLFAALAIIFASCQNEIMPGHVEEGIPTSIDFSISVPVAEDVNVTKASVAASESEIKELMLIMFEASGRKMVLDLTPYMDAGTVNEGYRKYGLTSPVDTDMYGGKVYSGTYKVYAVANWSSTFSSLADLDQLTEGDLKDQIATNPGFVYNITGSNRFPMSSITEGVEINPEGTSTLNIKLKRVVARIEFEFANGTGVQFTPTSYTIYNIPSQANLFSKDNNAMTGLGSEDFGISSEIEISSKSFEFFMLENVQVAKQAGCTTQALREAWTGGSESSVTSPENKNFTYAPTYGTFIVVKGSYTDADYIGDVTYTIHLGNFSEQANTANGKDFSNFKVNRNERQKYKVTVNGVRKIVTEVLTDSDQQPGAEGALAEKAENIFVLDAHYEKVMMDLTNVKPGSPSYLYIDTPYCVDNNGNGLVDLATITRQEFEALGLDYQWVRFIKPSSVSQFPNYSEASAGDVYDLIQDIIAGKQTYYAEIDGKKMTAAFVDEYFYEMKPDGTTPAVWTEFVNTDNRTMSIRPDVEYSQDGNSSLVQNSHLELSQRSIKTTYSFDGKDPQDGVYVPFGIETWDETWTSGGYFYTNNNNTYDPTGLTDDNGWNNTKILAKGTQPTNYLKAGYLVSVTDNTKESHVYSSYTGGLAYNACLLRNRDENGNKTIDDFELKWYLPAIEQYTNIWLSEDRLHEDTQLFDRSNLSGTINNDLNRSSVYFTSSKASKRLYWALEGASYGSYGSSWANPQNKVRCVRNLVATDSVTDGSETKSVYSGAPSDLAVNNSASNVISVDNVTSIRTIDHTGEYGIEHTERSADNLLPTAFEVAQVYLGEIVKAGELIHVPAKTWLVLNQSGCTGTRSGDYFNGYKYSLTISISSEDGVKYDYKGQAIDGTRTFENLTNPVLNVTVTKSDGTSKTIDVTYSFSSYSGRYQNVSYDGVEEAHDAYENEIDTGKPGSAKDTFAEDTFDATDLCSKGYYQQFDKSDLGLWRVPNQRELMLMLQFGYLVSSNTEGCFSSTYLTGHTSSFKNQPFGTYGTGLTLDTTGTTYMYVRCVMDAEYFENDDNETGGGNEGGGNEGGGNEGGGDTGEDEA